MTHCPLYNGTNLNFTGSQNPYGFIQQGGRKRKTVRKRKFVRRRKTRKTKKYRR